MSILIKNGLIAGASESFKGDLLIENGKISAVGASLKADAEQIIDAAGKIVMPGGIDPHVHLDMPFMGTFSSDDYASGTLAALHGGTTSVIDFVLQTQGKTLYDALREWQSRSLGNAYGDYSYHIAVTDFNENTRKEIKSLVKEEGISSFKTFMAYKGALMIDDNQMLGLMAEVKKHGGMVTAHATNGDMIDHLIAKHRSEGNLSPLYHYLSQPEVSESEAAGRFTDLAHYTGVPAYIVHLTCEGALNHVREATKRNQKMLVETCIQYLLLDAALYESEGFEGAKWVMSPPLRQQKDQETLWAGINQGLVQVVATDHCPFTWAQKQTGLNDFSKIPNGHPAIEHRMELLFSEGVNKGRISLNKFVEVTSANAAKIFGMYPQKGTLAIGADADIILFDPEKEHSISAKTHKMKTDYSAYEGWKLKGKCETVILRGKLAVDKGETLIQKGYGQFIKRGPSGGLF